jgi:hypothetical protein
MWEGDRDVLFMALMALVALLVLGYCAYEHRHHR